MEWPGPTTLRMPILPAVNVVNLSGLRIYLEPAYILLLPSYNKIGYLIQNDMYFFMSTSRSICLDLWRYPDASIDLTAACVRED